MLLEGLKLTGLDQHENSLDDDIENSFAVKCHQGLKFLSMVIGNDLFDMVLEFVSQVLNQSNQWHDKFISIMALSSCIEGPQYEMLEVKFKNNDWQLFDWIIQNGQDQAERVRSSTGMLLTLISEHCPSVLCSEEKPLTLFY
jgi:ankyrin repeat protein